MITISRIFNAFRDAEQFEKSTEERSEIWHLLVFPQYAFSIFAVPIYMTFTDNIWYLLTAGVLDIMCSWIAFEYFLNKFREKYK